MQLRNVQWGGLNCRVVQAESFADGAKANVMLCHGFGAPGDDLVPLADALFQLQPRLVATARFIFPEAPLALDLFPGGGRAWWRIDIEARFRKMQAGPDATGDLHNETPEGLGPARRQLLSAWNEMQATSHPKARSVLGGFSQGAMLATDLTLRLEEAPAGLAILSGTLISESAWKASASKRSGLRAFQSHGHSDAILPFGSAKALERLLSDSGVSVDFMPFDGGHAIPPPVLDRLGAYLVGVLGVG
jgi:phospholipase/carboxylesterase